MTQAMKKSLSITIRLVVLAILATLGIVYIVHKPPMESVRNYQKEDMPRPYVLSKSNSFFSSDEETASDSISITNRSGAYDEVRIGKQYSD